MLAAISLADHHHTEPKKLADLNRGQSPAEELP
jgi:hypothetical protein